MMEKAVTVIQSCLLIRDMACLVISSLSSALLPPFLVHHVWQSKGRFFDLMSSVFDIEVPPPLLPSLSLSLDRCQLSCM